VKPDFTVVTAKDGPRCSTVVVNHRAERANPRKEFLPRADYKSILVPFSAEANEAKHDCQTE